MPKIVYDTVTVIDTVHRVIADSVTIEALKNSQGFYATSFDRLVNVSLCVGSIAATIFVGYALVRYVFDHKTTNKIAKAQADLVRKELEEKFSEMMKPVVIMNLALASFDAIANDEKWSFRSFYHFLIALIYSSDLPYANKDLALQAIEGLEKSWDNPEVKAIEPHPALDHLVEYENFCKDKRGYEVLMGKARSLREKIESSKVNQAK